jgi:RNA polymerase sigma-70 factor, ECF subfamily
VLPDGDIVRRFQETGDNACFAELFTRHRQKVFFACRGFFPDGAAAEDATQEAFLRAYQNIHSFHGGDFSGWLMRIAKNVCIDQWRKRRPETGIEEIESTGRTAVGRPDANYDLRLAVQKVWQEVKSLSPEQRRCLEMKIGGYSYDETAARMGLPIEAVKSHLQNGRRMLWLKVEGMLSQLK